jgi:hypothetical protein
MLLVMAGGRKEASLARWRTAKPRKRMFVAMVTGWWTLAQSVFEQIYTEQWK